MKMEKSPIYYKPLYWISMDFHLQSFQYRRISPFTCPDPATCTASPTSSLALSHRRGTVVRDLQFDHWIL